MKCLNNEHLIFNDNENMELITNTQARNFHVTISQSLYNCNQLCSPHLSASFECIWPSDFLNTRIMNLNLVQDINIYLTQFFVLSSSQKKPEHSRSSINCLNKNSEKLLHKNPQLTSRCPTKKNVFTHKLLLGGITIQRSFNEHIS